MSKKLRFTLPGKKESIVELVEGRYVLGSLLSNDIVLDSHSAEPIHAMIEVHETGRCVLTDLGSVRGTQVNSSIVRVETDLSANDIITVGNIELLLFDDNKFDLPDIPKSSKEKRKPTENIDTKSN